MERVVVRRTARWVARGVRLLLQSKRCRPLQKKESDPNRSSARSGAKITQASWWHLDDTARGRVQRMAVGAPSSRFPSVVLQPSRGGSLTSCDSSMDESAPIIQVEHLVK